ncbi:XTP/dITP diphosphatase [Halobacillus shinanisalinarum]|uniref:dITP/XTP pyrophosphatase n=1 Tax=Halobacillus shinanisalinarum TaxID=2932258 RepID=A0ABY4H0V8_9BACI|nr:XTP/dITP diphosphatase [Halobacillus shinanisalinarum]UOQ93931.1 XTP/dITP diphosphatase [Halobacillus shinanisalinarum]
MKQLVIATKNAGKVTEFREMFSKYQISVKSLLDFDQRIDDIAENGVTFEENATIKAEAIAAKFEIPVVADDSGLEIDALDGAPGIYSARYAGEDKNDQKNLEKALRELDGVPDEQRTARFVCAVAVARPGRNTFTVRGTCEGTIARQPKGEGGFGYDPIFVPLHSDRTMAEHTSEEKNSISHRKHAILEIEKWLQDLT